MNVLFVCTANSCRSQMAETWAHHLFPPEWTVSSAGLLTYRITKRTQAIMTEVGLDMAGQKSKTLETFDLNTFDLIVTLSNESGQFLPELADPSRHVHRPVKDPMSFSGPPEETRLDYRRGRDEVRAIVEMVVNGTLGPGD